MSGHQPSPEIKKSNYYDTLLRPHPCVCVCVCVCMSGVAHSSISVTPRVYDQPAWSAALARGKRPGAAFEMKSERRCLAGLVVFLLAHFAPKLRPTEPKENAVLTGRRFNCGLAQRRIQFSVQEQRLTKNYPPYHPWRCVWLQQSMPLARGVHSTS